MLQPSAATQSQDHALLAIIARVTTGLFMAIMSALVKAAGEAGANPGEIIFFRSAVALPVVLLWIATGPGLAAIKTRRPGLHLTRAAIGLVSMSITFYALGVLPLAEAMTIFFAAPLIATCLSAIFLGEKVGWHRWVAIMAGFIGVFIVMQPGNANASVPVMGLGAALAAAVLMACVTLTVRQISGTEHQAAIVFWFTVTGTVVLGCLYPFFYHSHPWTTWALMAAVGVTGAVVQISMTISLRLGPISLTAPFDYAQLFWASLIGWLLWSNAPATNTLIGGIIIAGAGVYTFYRERVRRQSIAGATMLES